MKTFYEAIYEWVVDNFGQSEADDPSWNIKALADHLSKSNINPDELNASTRWLVYDELRDWNLEEDIDQLAEDKGLTFTKDEVAKIKHQYYKMDNETRAQLSAIMDNIIMWRGKK